MTRYGWFYVLVCYWFALWGCTPAGDTLSLRESAGVSATSALWLTEGCYEHSLAERNLPNVPAAPLPQAPPAVSSPPDPPAVPTTPTAPFDEQAADQYLQQFSQPAVTIPPPAKPAPQAAPPQKTAKPRPAAPRPAPQPVWQPDYFPRRRWGGGGGFGWNTGNAAGYC